MLRINQSQRKKITKLIPLTGFKTYALNVKKYANIVPGKVSNC